MWTCLLDQGLWFFRTMRGTCQNLTIYSSNVRISLVPCTTLHLTAASMFSMPSAGVYAWWADDDDATVGENWLALGTHEAEHTGLQVFVYIHMEQVSSLANLWCPANWRYWPI